MTRDDQQRRKQDLASHLRKMADDEELERLRQLRPYKRQWPDPCYAATFTTPKARQEGAKR